MSLYKLSKNFFERNFFILGFGHLFKILIVIINNRVLTYYLNDQNLTSFYLLISISTLFSLGFINPLGGVFLTKYLYTFHLKNHVLKAFSFLFKKFLIIPFIIFSICIYFYFKIKFYDLEQIGFILIILYIIPRSFNDSFISVFNLIDRNKRFIYLLNLNLILSLFFSFLFINIFEVNFIYWFLGIVVTQILIMIYSIKHYNKIYKNNNKFTIEFNSKNYDFSNQIYYYFIIINLLVWFFVEGYKVLFDFYIDDFIILDFLLGFVIAYQIVSTIESFNHNLNAPNFLQNINSKNYALKIKSFLKFLKRTIFLVFTAYILCFFGKSQIINILVDSTKINENVFYYFKLGCIYFSINTILNLFKMFYSSCFELKKLFKSYASGILIFFVLVWFDFNPVISLIVGLLSVKLFLIIDFFIKNFKILKNAI